MKVCTCLFRWSQYIPYKIISHVAFWNGLVDYQLVSFYLTNSFAVISCTTVSALGAILLIAHATVISVDMTELVDATNLHMYMYCNIWQKLVLAHSYHLTCVSCKGVVHLNGLPKITRDYAIDTQRHLNQFYCTLCLNDMLPFNNLDDEALCEVISEIQLKQTSVSFQMLQNQ